MNTPRIPCPVCGRMVRRRKRDDTFERHPAAGTHRGDYIHCSASGCPVSIEAKPGEEGT